MAVNSDSEYIVSSYALDSSRFQWMSRVAECLDVVRLAHQCACASARQGSCRQAKFSKLEGKNV